MLTIDQIQASLVPFDQDWMPPSRELVRSVLAAAKLDVPGAARYVGVSRKAVNGWTTGTDNVPYSCWALLCWKAGIPAFWDVQAKALSDDDAYDRSHIRKILEDATDALGGEGWEMGGVARGFMQESIEAYGRIVGRQEAIRGARVYLDRLAGSEEPTEFSS